MYSPAVHRTGWRMRNWREVGGSDRTITVVHIAEGRSTLELFLQHFGLKNRQTKAQVIIGDNQQGIKTVTGNPGAIGYVSIGTAEYESTQGAPIRLLPMDGVAATVANVRNGRFPLSRPLNLVTRDEVTTELAKRFIDFARSETIHDPVAAQVFVPPPLKMKESENRIFRFCSRNTPGRGVSGL